MDGNYISCEPNADNLIESIRSIGYTLDTAMADIIDNSISANATNVQIFLREYMNEPYIQFIDNGKGMSKSELLEAMRIGSKNPNEKRSEEDLGRFGLGLKTASFSQAKNLTVISKQNNLIYGFKWDLDLVSEKRQFLIIELTDEGIDNIPNIKFLNQYDSGTIVMWQKFDKIQLQSSDLITELSDLLFKTTDHLSLIFHRIMSENNFEIFVNNEKLNPKDPFLSNNPGTQVLETKKIKVDDSIVKVEPFILPHFSRLTNEDKRLSGKIEDQSKNQGFYLYRNKRLIVWGDYFGLSRKGELTKNLRIKVDIPNNLDYLWDIDVKKSRAIVPSKLKKNLVSAISSGEDVSKRVNTFKGKKEIEKENPLWICYIKQNNDFTIELNRKNNLYSGFQKSLSEEQSAYFKLLENSIINEIPINFIYSKIADGDSKFVTKENDVSIELEEKIKILKQHDSLDLKEILKILINTEPYKSDEKSQIILQKELLND